MADDDNTGAAGDGKIVQGDFSDGGKKKRRKKKGDDAARLESVAASGTLPPGCPVTPLGHDNDTYFFTDHIGQIRTRRDGDFTPLKVTSLFGGDTGWLKTHFAPQSKRGTSGLEKIGWHNASAVEALMKACTREGFFDPPAQTRGPGVWPIGEVAAVGEIFAGAEQLVIHFGDRVGVAFFSSLDGHMSIDWHKAGAKIGTYVYPAAKPLAPMADAPASDDEVEEAVAFLRRWVWRDGGMAPWLLLGAIGVSYMPTPMPFRPWAWIQGGSGQGKSTLVMFILLLLLGRALKYEKTTEARLREDFGKRNDTRTVICNEAEVSSDNRRLEKLVHMARNTYMRGEGTYGTGGSGGSAQEITTNFIFAAIEPPPLDPQDANRGAMLRLGKLKASKAETDQLEAMLGPLAKRLAPKLMRRAVESWARFTPVFNAFRGALMAKGHDQRGANTFGTLLTMAHLLRYQGLPDESDVAEWCGQLDPKLLAMTQDTRSTEGLCLLHIMSHLVAPYRSGEQLALGDLVRDALHSRSGGPAQATIKKFGLAAVNRPDKDKIMRRWLAVSNKHQGLEAIFKGTRWAGGSWMNALRLIPDTMASDPVWFAGSQDRATLIPLEWFPKKPTILDADPEAIEDVEGEGGPHGAS